MATANRPKKTQDSNHWTIALFSLLGKLVDSGFGVLVILGLILVALVFGFAYHLNSTDSLTFLTHAISLKGLGGIAILIAIFQPLIYRMLLEKSRAADKYEIERLRALTLRYEKHIALSDELKLDTPEDS